MPTFENMRQCWWIYLKDYSDKQASPAKEQTHTAYSNMYCYCSKEFKVYACLVTQSEDWGSGCY